MIVWILIIFFLSLYKSKYCKSGISDYYISKDGTDAVKGIFILLIMASHFVQYVPAFTEPVDIYYMKIRTYLGQFVVCMFLFYSGYGVTLSFNQKGESYLNSFIRKRVLHTALIYDLAILIYWIVQYELGKRYTLGHYLLSLVAWKSIGNSNWYIFTIIVLYLISYIAAKTYKSEIQNIAVVVIGCVALTQIHIMSGNEALWYNTLMCYPLGVLYYYVRPQAEKFMSKNVHYFMSLFILAAMFILTHKFWRVHLLIYELCGLLFTIIIVMITMKLNIRNPLLKTAGRYLYDLFLMHRIPMILFERIPVIKDHVHIYFMLSVLSAFLCAYLFRLLVNCFRGKRCFPLG